MKTSLNVLKFKKEKSQEAKDGVNLVDKEIWKSLEFIAKNK